MASRIVQEIEVLLVAHGLAVGGQDERMDLDPTDWEGFQGQIRNPMEEKVVDQDSQEAGGVA